MNYRNSGAALATVLAAMSLAGAAHAQVTPLPTLDQVVPTPNLDIDIDNAYGRGRNISVLDRERPEYDSIGEHVGSFTLFPRFELAAGYTDNVYATKANVIGDGLFIIKPSMELQSNWSRHSFDISAGGEFHEFASNSTQDQTGWFVHSNARLDVYGDSYVLFGADAEHSFEARTDAGSPIDAARPVPTQNEFIYTRGVWQLNRFRSTLGIQDRESDDSNVPSQDLITHAINGVLKESDLDRNDWEITGREEFAISPDTAVFAQAGFTQSVYAHPRVVVPLTAETNETLSRNSTEYRGLVGANFDLASLMRGEIGFGYVDRQYAVLSALRYPTISGAAFEGKLEYFPNELTTVTLVGSRLVQDAIYSISSGGYFDNSVTLRVDHELLRNLLLNASVGYDRDDYQGADRHDYVYNIQGGANYFVSRDIGIGVTVSYANRNATGAVFDNPTLALARPQFDVTSVMFSLVLQR